MAEEAAIDLTIKTGDAEKNTQSLKSRLKELKAELAGLDEGSAEFNKLAAEAGKVQDKIGDINKRVNNLASDTKKLDAVVGVAQGIAGGFAAAQGAIALFGQENEDLNKTLVKVQGSIALLNGVQQIANTLNKDSAVMTTLAGAAQTAYATVVGVSTGAMKLFRLALAATGIGAIVIGLGLLIANFDKVTETVKSTINRFDFLKLTIDKLGQAWSFVSDKVRDFLSQFGIMDSAIEHQASLLNEAAIKDLERVIKAKEQEIAIRKALGEKTYDLEQELFDARIDLAKAKGEDETAILIEQITAQRLVREADAKAQAEAEKKRLEDIEAARKEKEKEIKEAREKEELAIKEAQDEIALMQKEAEATIDAADREKKLEEMRLFGDSILEHAKKLAADQLLIEQEAAALSLFTAQVNQRAKESLLTSGFSFAKNIAGLAIKDARKQAIAMKAIALVELAINTAKSISNAITGATSSATATGPGAVVATPIFIASQIATVLAAAAQAAAIIGAPLPSASSSSSSAPSVGDFSTTGTGNNAPGVPQTPQSIPIPQQVYVTETDITGVQSQVNVIEGLSKIE